MRLLGVQDVDHSLKEIMINSTSEITYFEIPCVFKRVRSIRNTTLLSEECFQRVLLFLRNQQNQIQLSSFSFLFLGMSHEKNCVPMLFFRATLTFAEQGKIYTHEGFGKMSTRDVVVREVQTYILFQLYSVQELCSCVVEEVLRCKMFHIIKNKFFLMLQLSQKHDYWRTVRWT